MSELDEIYNLWERFTNDEEIDIGLISQRLASATTITEDELPQNYLSVEVKQLEKYFEKEENEEAIRSIKILKKFKNQHNVKILFYDNCLNTLISKKNDNQQVGNLFFDLLEVIVDPRYIISP